MALSVTTRMSRPSGASGSTCAVTAGGVRVATSEVAGAAVGVVAAAPSSLVAAATAGPAARGALEGIPAAAREPSAPG